MTRESMVKVGLWLKNDLTGQENKIDSYKHHFFFLFFFLIIQSYLQRYFIF